MTKRCVACAVLLAVFLVSGSAEATPGRASRSNVAASFLRTFQSWALPVEAARSGEEGFFALTKWLVPPQHKKDFASTFLDTKEKVLKTNGGVKRIDLLEPAMDMANFIFIDICEFEDEKAYKEHLECDAVKELKQWVCEHNVVLFHTPIKPVSGGEGSAARGEALSPIVIKELESQMRLQALMGGELGMGALAAAAQSREELGMQLDAHAATRNRGAWDGGDGSDKVVLFTKYFVPPSVASDFKSKWVELKDKSLESEEGTEEYCVFNPCVTNAIYFSYEVYADWDAAKKHLSEDFVNGWWEYTRKTNIPVKALPLVFVCK